MKELREVVELLEGDWREQTDLVALANTEIFDKRDGQKYLVRIAYSPSKALPVNNSYVVMFTGHDGKETFTDPIGFDTLEALLLYMMANGYAKDGIDAAQVLKEEP